MGSKWWVPAALILALAGFSLPRLPGLGATKTPAAATVANKRQYYDMRQARYYYFDTATGRYYWENGEPRFP